MPIDLTRSSPPDSPEIPVSRNTRRDGGVSPILPICLILSCALAAYFANQSAHLERQLSNAQNELLHQKSLVVPKNELASDVVPASKINQVVKPQTTEVPSTSTTVPDRPQDGAAQFTQVPPSIAPEGHEETTLSVEHSAIATLKDGKFQKVRLKVPVFYKSRSLRMDPEKSAELQQFYVRLKDHQQKIKALRSEGLALLQQWNRFVSQNTPIKVLHTDSVTLPLNQGLQSPNRPDLGDIAPDLKSSQP